MSDTDPPSDGDLDHHVRVQALCRADVEGHDQLGVDTDRSQGNRTRGQKRRLSQMSRGSAKRVLDGLLGSEVVATTDEPGTLTTNQQEQPVCGTNLATGRWTRRERGQPAMRSARRPQGHEPARACNLSNNERGLDPELHSNNSSIHSPAGSTATHGDDTTSNPELDDTCISSILDQTAATPPFVGAYGANGDASTLRN